MFDSGVLGDPPDEIVARIRFSPDGLVPVVVQQWDTGLVLMVAWMDEQAVHATLTDRRGTYYSRSRGRQWVKGETSGNFQDVRAFHLDCDGDTVLLQVEQTGPACHTGHLSCFEVEGRDGGHGGE